MIFDMDGTLIDSEINTEISVAELLREHGLSPEGHDFNQYYGRTWERIEELLQKAFPALADRALADALQDRFHELFKTAELIPGAREFLTRVAADRPIAIATSSQRESLAHLIDRMDIADAVRVAIGAEDYSASKPDPECYLLAADKLNVAPADCLVFEDSIPGLRAARAAGMRAVAITHRSPDAKLAADISDMAIRDYTLLPSDFPAPS